MLAVVSNGERAMVVLFEEIGDAGEHAIDRSMGTSESGGYVLSNGQHDTYPDRDTVPLEIAMQLIDDVIAGRPREAGRYPPELKERACRLVHDWRKARDRSNGGFNEIAVQLDVHPESLRSWFKQWQIDSGEKPGLTTADQRRIAELEAEVKELERSNAVLKSASAFFAAELDRPRKR